VSEVARSEPDHDLRTAPALRGDELARQWVRGLRISHLCHARLTSRYENRARTFGVLLVAISAVVGTAIFSSLSQSPNDLAKIATGTLSVVATVCAAMNSALRYPELAERHRTSGVAYGELRRRFEQALVSDAPVGEDLFSSVRTEWDRIDAAAPGIPPKMHHSVRDELRRSARRTEGEDEIEGDDHD